MTEKDIVTWLRRHGGAGYGGRTWQIARAANLPTTQVRRILIRLEKDGLVIRDLRLSSANDIWWSLTAAAIERGEHMEGSSDGE